MQGALGEALSAAENYVLAYGQHSVSERLGAIRDDYRLMVDYWQRGFQDPQRQRVYQRQLQRLSKLVTDLQISEDIKKRPFVLNAYNRCRASRQDWSLAALRHSLEDYVSEQALLELKPEHTRAEEERLLHERHQQLLSNLFDYVWTSHTWSENTCQTFTELLLSPTVNADDQRLLVSAVTLALLDHFDYYKLRVLMSAYSRSTDEPLRQRALVGWALGLDSQQLKLWPEAGEMLQQLTADERCRQELKELQMQLVYCLKTEEDTQKVQQEIIPEIIKNNDQFRITRNGIEEIEEDSLEDILHPEASEQRMEKLEATMQRMIDMQRAGSDIYFGGFAQMKRFPFFNDTCNWFMPFTAKHPALREVMAKERHARLLLGLLRRSPFCDSDAYSFALGFHMAVSKLPKSMLEMLDRGELSVIGEQMGSEDMQQPPFLRRKYLQDLYRFFRLFPSRSIFSNPFDNSPSPTGNDKHLFFFAEPAFAATPLAADMVELAAFLIKQRYRTMALQVLQNCSETQRDERYYLALAALQITEQAVGSYRAVLAINPQNTYAMKGLARALFAIQDYEGALSLYDQLLDIHPDHHRFLLNKAVCLTHLQQYEEALKILYKMNYEQPDDQTVNRVLAWTLVGDGKQEQAAKIYVQLIQEEPQPDDLQNYAFCRWLAGDIAQAIDLFRRYAAACAEKGLDNVFDFGEEEMALLHRHGISDVEIRLMRDALSSNA